MPFTPYHFGPSGFLGLVFRRWIDLPVFLLANVIVDVEVLIVGALGLGWPIHRYAHTLLLGAVVGILWAMAAYPLRNIFAKLMQLFRLPYTTSFHKMILSGILGVWLHVFIDGVYHYDVQVFWPNTKLSLWRAARTYFGRPPPEVMRARVETICIYLLIAGVVLYVLTVVVSLKKDRVRSKIEQQPQN